MQPVVAAGTLAFVLAGFTIQACAQTTGAASSLLDQARRRQLERWLGKGEFSFNNAFTLRPGATAHDFHGAVDGKGATFTLLDVTNAAGNSFLVGGYNPQSWSSTDGWHVTASDSERTAFLFNMTEPALYRQVPATYILPSQGSRQSFNQADHGPTFGAGPDLFVGDRLDTAFAWQVTYGDPLNQGRSLIDGTVGGQLVHVNALELYTLAPVPEPAPAGMLGAGLGLVGLRLRRRRALARLAGPAAQAVA
jgi:hypothetical protein